MRLPALAAIVAILSAGCIGSPVEDAARAAANSVPPGEALTITTVLVDDARDGGEPSVEVAPDGTLYVCGPTGTLHPEHRSSHLWRSDDGGATWTWLDPGPAPGAPVRTRGTAVGGGDCDLAVDAAGQLYFTDLTLAEVSLARSEDRGETWSWTTPAAMIPLDDRNWLAAGAEDEVLLAANNLAIGIIVSRSTDGGVTFPEQWVVSHAGVTDREGDHGCICATSNLARSADGARMAIAWVRERAPLDAGVAFTTDGGATWTEGTIVKSEGSGVAAPFPSLAYDDAGNLFAAWAEGAGEYAPEYVVPGVLSNGGAFDGVSRIRMAVSRDGGATWGAAVPVTSPSETADEGLPWISAGSEGRVVVTFARSDAGASGDWHVHVAVSTDALADAPTFAESRASTEPAMVGETGRPLWDFFQNAIGLDGRAVVAWAAESDGVQPTWFARQDAGPLLRA